MGVPATDYENRNFPITFTYAPPSSNKRSIEEYSNQQRLFN